MILEGRTGSRGSTQPRVIQISIARFARTLPRPGEPLEFLVSIHEEGTGITWQQNITVEPKIEQYLLETTDELYGWSQTVRGPDVRHLRPQAPPDADTSRPDLTAAQALKHVQQLGEALYGTFLGADGRRYLQQLLNDGPATAILLDVDETILNLPWEALHDGRNFLVQQTPFGRLVTTRLIPRPGRPTDDRDPTVRILVIADPTRDLPAAATELKALRALPEQFPSFTMDVHFLEQEQATREHFRTELSQFEYDIIHFAGHADLDERAPENSALFFADGPLTADEIVDLPWISPPFLVFNSACESGDALGGKALVSGDRHSNGLAAAFLAAGVYGYMGYFWPVTDNGACLFAENFYAALFQQQNVGLAFQIARDQAIAQLAGDGDLAGFSAVFYGDSATKERRDLATSA